MGRPFYYSLTAKQLEDRINSYFQYLKDNPEVKGGPSDFLSYVDLDITKAREIVKNPLKPYEEHRKLLLKAAVMLRAHLETSPAWSGKDAAKAIYLTKQQLWDGQAYTDRQEINANTNNTVKIQFGSGKAHKKAEDEAFD